MYPIYVRGPLAISEKTGADTQSKNIFSHTNWKKASILSQDFFSNSLFWYNCYLDYLNNQADTRNSDNILSSCHH